MEQRKKAREMMKGMTGKEKAEYIWEYYKYGFIAGAFVIGLIIYTIVLVSSRLEPALNVVITSGAADTQAISTRLEDSLLTQEQKRDYEVVVRHIPFEGEQIQAIVALISAAQVDVFIGNEVAFSAFYSNDDFLDLSQFHLPEAMLKDKYVVNFTPFAQEFGITSDEPLYLAVVANSPHIEMVQKFFDYISE